MRCLVWPIAALCLVPALAFARDLAPRDPVSDLCIRAIAAVEPGTRIPANLLGAIGRVESGRTDVRDGAVKAWPWTINAEGRGRMFATKADAITAVTTLRARGVMSVDVGCMQVNLMHHPNAFATLDDAFDPLANVRYAARFLTELHSQTPDWTVATAYYHSKTPDLAEPYKLRVLAELPGAARVQAAAKSDRDLASAWEATTKGGQTASPLESHETFKMTGLGKPVSPRTSRIAMLTQR